MDERIKLTLPDQHCSNCNVVMDVSRAIWWTERGTCCSESCARELNPPKKKT